MLRILTAFAFFLPFVAGGCNYTWQANNASQAVDFNPLAVGGPTLSPANGPGYIDGQPQDMRRR